MRIKHYVTHVTPVKTLFFICVLSLCTLATPLTRTAHAQEYQTQTKPSLVADHTTVYPGQTFYLGLYMEHSPEWHTYWKNPGDSGQPPSLKWQNLPQGVDIAPMQWPAPKVIPTPPLTTYGYEGKKLFPMRVTLDKTFPLGRLELNTKASWLECKDICLPAQAELTLALTVANTAIPSATWAPIFKKEQSALPQKLSTTGQAYFKEETVHFSVSFPQGNLPKNPRFLPYSSGIIDNGLQKVAYSTENTATLTAQRHPFHKKAPEVIKGIIISQNTPAYIVAFNKVENTPITATQTPVQATLIKALIFAFIGGLILNLMPCVLPVLALKLTHVIQHAHKTAPWPHGVAFSAGVLSSFWVLAGVLLALQSAGHALGWGFQLQNPVFVLLISFILLLVALNLFGVFEVGASLTQFGQKPENKKSSLPASFLTGVLATVVATPCTAPFMGTALAFTLGKSAFITLTIFSALALGLSLPYLLVTLKPSLLKSLPKPGAWMVTLKQFLAFPILATVVWLLWVLGNQTNNNILGIVLIAMVVLGASTWIWGKFTQNFAIKSTHRISAAVLAGLLFLGAVIGGINAIDKLATPPTEKQIEGTLVFTPTLAEELQQKGTPSLSVFTADWCITCKVNEALVLNTEPVQKALKETGTKVIIADWTNKNPEITKTLQKYGRAGVPFYVYTPAQKAKKATPLPEVITTDMLLQVLNGEAYDNRTQ